MMNIIVPIAVLAGLGVFFGIILAFAARKFAVPADETLENIIRHLPGANCGSCGRAGCAGFAQALLAGELDLSSCSVMAEEKRQTLAQLLGLNLELKEKRVACVHCNGGFHAKDKYVYTGLKDCLAANMLMGGQKECRFGCLTYGTCAKACPFGAISMTSEGYPKVDETKCTACGVCVNICPKKLYDFIPHDTKTAPVYIGCSSRDVGKVVMNVCGRGCIACGKCEKACPTGAFKVVDKLARIDYTKCSGCGACAGVCPTKVIKLRVVNA
jgi:electron transport complex protein RnfB